MRIPHSILGLALLSTVFAGPARAQVVISEIEFTAGWIELTNRGTAEVDISKWSIYQATKTTGRPQNYWFAIPGELKLKPAEFVRVHWMKPIPTSNNDPTEIYTGETVFHFLFGLWAEPLDNTSGALALIASQNNNDMNTPSLIMDWVSWGTSGFKREDLAVTAGRWTKDSVAPAALVVPRPSLAYSYTHVGQRKSGADWFLDSSPTPKADNLGGAFARSYGTSCVTNQLPIANQITNGVPTKGHNDFWFGIDRTLSTSEFGLVMLGTANTKGILIPTLGCSLYLDLPPAVFEYVPTDGQGFSRWKINPDTVPGLAGFPIGSQWLVANFTTNALGFTNGFELQFYGGK